MTEEISDELRNDKEWKYISERINDFTTFLNKYHLEYKVKMWGDAEGYTISIDKVEVNFSLGGNIQFEVSDEVEE